MLKSIATMPPKIYTKKGDKGLTGTLGGKRIAKSHPIIIFNAYMDDFNASLGFLRAKEFPGIDKSNIYNIQNHCFTIGAYVSSGFTYKFDEKVFKNNIVLFEKDIDRMTAELPPLKNFVIAGDEFDNCFIHSARTKGRMVELYFWAILDDEKDGKLSEQDLLIGQYLNRLSDWLFTLARYHLHKVGVEQSLFLNLNN